jgi:hypothetical protein
MKKEVEMFWVIIFAIGISIFCWLVLSWADAHLFTVLGEVETCRGIETCYMYDALSIPARIVCFMCGVAAITIFVVTWFGVYAIITM